MAVGTCGLGDEYAAIHQHSQSAIVALPTPLYYGLGFDWICHPAHVVFMVTSLETIGDITDT